MNAIDKKKISLEEALDSKSLKAKKTKDLERILQTLLTTEQDNDATVNIIIAELMKRGVSKEEITKVSGDKEKIKKAFDSLNLDIIKSKINDDEVEMDKKEFVDEHKNLVKILKEGTKEEREEEAEEQESELKKELKKSFDNLNIDIVIDTIEKGGKKMPGYVSPDGKWRKTASGWERIKKDKGTSTDTDEKKYIKEREKGYPSISEIKTKNDYNIDEIKDLYNSGKSMSPQKAVNLLKKQGIDATYREFKGYVDTKLEGQKYASTRKEKNFYEVVINRDGKTTTFNSQNTQGTSYALTGYVLDELRGKHGIKTVDDKTELYQRQPFVSQAIKEGDKVLFRYNDGKDWVKVHSITDGVALIAEQYSNTIGDKYLNNTSRNITKDVKTLQNWKDEIDRVHHEKEEDIKELTFNLVRDSGINITPGGDLLDRKNIKQLYDDLESLKKAAERYTTNDSSVGAGGFSGANSSTMNSMKSGNALSYDFNGTHSGSYYEGNTPYLVQVRSGGALDLKVSTSILNAARKILEKYSYKTELGEAKIYKTNGTNWSSVMLMAPQDNNLRGIIDIDSLKKSEVVEKGLVDIKSDSLEEVEQLLKSRIEEYRAAGTSAEDIEKYGYIKALRYKISLLKSNSNNQSLSKAFDNLGTDDILNKINS